MRAVVVGAGVGGLAASIRLAAAGHDVTVLERNPMVGGKLATLDEEGWRFDIGPTLLTLPHVFDELLSYAGTSLADEVELVRLDPQIRYRWPNGSVLELPDDPAATPGAIEAFSPGSGERWKQCRTSWTSSSSPFTASSRARASARSAAAAREIASCPLSRG